MNATASNTSANLFEVGHVLFGIAGTLLYHEPTSLAVEELAAERALLLDPLIQGLLPAASPALHDALASAEGDKSLLLQDYTALFIQRTVSKAYPWESVYTTHDHTLFGETTLEVQSIYRSFDIELGTCANEPQDHIGLEFMFLSILSERGIEALDAGDTAEAERLAKTIASFLSQHIEVFANDFLSVVEAKAQTDYYKAVCLFTREMLAWANESFMLA